MMDDDGDAGLKWSSVRLTLHHDEISQSNWWQVDEVISGKLLGHFNTTSSSSSSSSSSSVTDRVDDVVINPFLSIVSFNERVPTGVLSIFDNYGSVCQRLLTYLFHF